MPCWRAARRSCPPSSAKQGPVPATSSSCSGSLGRSWPMKSAVHLLKEGQLLQEIRASRRPPASHVVSWARWSGCTLPHLGCAESCGVAALAEQHQRHPGPAAPIWAEPQVPCRISLGRPRMRAWSSLPEPACCMAEFQVASAAGGAAWVGLTQRASLVAAGRTSPRISCRRLPACRSGVR